MEINFRGNEFNLVFSIFPALAVGVAEALDLD
jgi:hypothetical protein